MKRAVWLIVLSLLAVPAFAQDNDGGGFFDVNELFGGDPFGDNPDSPSAPKFDPLVDLRAWLKRAGAPALDKKQEKPLNNLYQKEVKAMEKTFEKQFGISLASAIAAQSPARGRRGGIRTTPQQTAEIRRLSEQLMDKLIAGLRMDQQGGLRRYQSEQIRVRRLNVLNAGMVVAGLPLTPEPKSEIEGLYARESHLRTLIIVEAKGQPHQYKISQLETLTTQRVVRALQPDQRVALAETMDRLRAR